jgi:leucyl-tRNA synthetase
VNKDELIQKAMQNERIKEYTDGKNIIKQIAVPDKLVNIVVK